MSKSDTHIPYYRGKGHQPSQLGEFEDEIGESSNTVPANDATNAPRHRPVKDNPKKHNVPQEKQS